MDVKEIDAYYFFIHSYFKCSRFNRSVSYIDSFNQSFRIAITVVKHAGHVLVLSGAILIIVSGWKWTDSWIVLTVAIMLISIVFLASAFKPTLKTFGTSRYKKEEFIKKLRKATWKYIILLLIMLWLMVDKPMLW